VLQSLQDSSIFRSNTEIDMLGRVGFVQSRCIHSAIRCFGGTQSSRRLVISAPKHWEHQVARAFTKAATKDKLPEDMSFRTKVDGLYKGEMLDGKKNGHGTFTHAEYTYEGEWVNDQRHGKGVLSYTNGKVYEGEFRNGQKHGKGRVTYPNGDVYEGDWENGLRQGQGVYKNANGTKWVGLCSETTRSTREKEPSLRLITRSWRAHGWRGSLKAGR
jgi:hypothetical protein